MNVSIIVEDIESIEEVKSRFTATINLIVEWTDARLTWNDLADDIDLNIPSNEIKKMIWFPKINIKNSENNMEIPNDSKSKLRVKKKGNLTMSSKENLRETALFDGSENPLIYSRQFNIKLKCVFNLAFFPFDTQTCSISLNTGNEERNLIRLVGENVDFIGNRELATFDVIRWELETGGTSSPIDVKMNIILKRKISQHLLGIYLPSIFIMVIAQVIKHD